MNIPLYFEKDLIYYVEVRPDSDACPWFYSWHEEKWNFFVPTDPDFSLAGVRRFSPNQLPFPIEPLPVDFLRFPIGGSPRYRIIRTYTKVIVGGYEMEISRPLYERLRLDGHMPQLWQEITDEEND